MQQSLHNWENLLEALEDIETTGVQSRSPVSSDVLSALRCDEEMGIACLKLLLYAVRYREEPLSLVRSLDCVTEPWQPSNQRIQTGYGW